jgi:hypothetical protein
MTAGSNFIKRTIFLFGILIVMPEMDVRTI